MKFDKAKGVIVVPCWKSAVFLPKLCQKSSVQDWIDLPANSDFYTRCKSAKGIFGNTDCDSFYLLIFHMEINRITYISILL
jgi:hypothetical protein